MKFTIPYAYHAEYVAKRKRNVEKAALLATIEIDVEEVETPGEPAFVVGCDTAGETYGYWQRFPLLEGRPVRVWRLDGDCYAELCRPEELVERLEVEKDNPFHVWTTGGRHATPFESMDRLERKDLTSYEAISKGGLRSWADDGGQARGELIQRRAQALRVVDGMVCIRVNEPIVKLASGRDGNSLIVAITEDHDALPDGFATYDEFNDGRRYRLDRLDEAREYARAHAAQAGLRLIDHAVVETPDAARLLLLQEAEHLYDDAADLTRFLGRNLAELPRDVALAWRRLQDAIDECPPNHATPGLSAACEDLVGALDGRTIAVAGGRAAQSSIHSWLSPLDQEGFSFGLGVFLPRLRVSLQKWYDRVPHEEDWADRALPLAASPDRRMWQVLSRLELRRIADELRISSSMLERAVADGDHLVFRRDERTDRGEQRKPFVAIVSPEMALRQIVGELGREPVGADLDGLRTFLAENVRRREEADTLDMSLVA